PAARADGLRELDQTIFGMDCAPCAAGVEQGLRKLHGVTSVRVSLNEGKAVVTLTAGNRTTLAQVREVIRHNGFTPKDARATLVGRVMRQSDQWWIDTGSGRFVLEADSATLQRQLIAQEAGGDVQLIVRIPETLSNPPTVQLLTAVTSAQ
ncbi:MAG TPA: heavy metal-associated domain-containing protein, partial [Steroidobacteraceae bacterium]|nr:heavy metal-associated domain-containing protein [Steroidobacteraceae bacterium]